MSNLDIQVFGLPQVAAMLRRFPEETRRASLEAMDKALFIVEARAKQKLSGEVLKVRTGRLRASIGSPGQEGIRRVEQEPEAVTGAIGTAVVYGRIHEFGGLIPAHVVRPVRKQALRFFIGGREVFAKKAVIPDVVMPARPYLRPALEESRNRIQEVFAIGMGRVIRRLTEGTGAQPA